MKIDKDVPVPGRPGGKYEKFRHMVAGDSTFLVGPINIISAGCRYYSEKLFTCRTVTEEHGGVMTKGTRVWCLGERDVHK